MWQMRTAVSIDASEQASGANAVVEETSSTRLAIPKRRGRRHCGPVLISEADEARLTLFFGALGTRFERSVCGRILEIQEVNGAFSARCRRCKGTGIVDGPGGFAVVLQEVKRSRQSTTQRHSIEAIPDESQRWENEKVEAPSGGWCRPCNGTGTVPKPQGAMPPCEVCAGRGRVAALTGGSRAAPCSGCLGTGRTRTTVELTSQADRSSSSSITEEALTTYAVTSRQLAGVRSRSAVCARAIELLLGDQGARWARTAHGRLFALYQETPAGKRLARWAEARVVAEKERQLKKEGRKLPKADRWTNPEPQRGAVPDADERASKTWSRRQARWVRAMFRHKDLRDFIGPIQEAPRPAGWLSGDRVPLRTHQKPRPDIELTVQDRIWSEAVSERTHPDPFRGKLLREAAEQAHELYLRASKLWVRVGNARRKPTERQVEESAAVMRLVTRLEKRGGSDAARYVTEQGQNA